VLEHAASLQPNALIVVVGYYPIVSPKSSRSAVFNTWLDSLSFPRALKPITNNGATRALFFTRICRKSVVRSRIWFDESNRYLQAAVDKLNKKYDVRRSVFIESPITEDTC